MGSECCQKHLSPLRTSVPFRVYGFWGDYGSISDVEMGMSQTCCGNDRRVRTQSCDISSTLQVATHRREDGWHQHETDMTSDLEAIKSGHEDENFDPRDTCEPGPAVPAVAISHISEASEQLNERQTSAGRPLPAAATSSDPSHGNISEYVCRYDWSDLAFGSNVGTGAGGSVCAGSLGGLAHVAIKVMHDSDSGSLRQEVLYKGYIRGI